MGGGRLGFRRGNALLRPGGSSLRGGGALIGGDGGGPLLLLERRGARDLEGDLPSIRVQALEDDNLRLQVIAKCWRQECRARYLHNSPCGSRCWVGVIFSSRPQICYLQHSVVC